MNLLAPLCVLLVATFNPRATVSGQSLSCTYDGQTHEHGQIFPHRNGCAKVQCQFGQVITIHEACGTELDGQCHSLNSAFLYQTDTYQCAKYSNNGIIEYRLDLIIQSPRGCDINRNHYDNLQTFKGPNGCGDYQCQDGQIINFKPQCGTETDGKCHYAGEWFTVGQTYYVCQQRQQGGQEVLENVPLATPPTTTRSCNFPTAQYVHLEVFSTGCLVRQCQDGKAPVVGQACNFGKDSSCRGVGEQWLYSNRVYGCRTFVGTDGRTMYSTGTVDDPVSRCKLGETWYNHLDTFTSSDGCRSKQCVDGNMPATEEACTVDGECKPADSIWIKGGYTYKCVFGDGWKVRVMDENGNVVESTNGQPDQSGTLELDDGCGVIADIIFIDDASGSIGQQNFNKQLQFQNAISSIFTLGPNDVRIGMIVFSGDAQLVYGLDAYDNHDDMAQATNSAPYLWNITETHKAFNMVVDQKLFSAAKGGRDDADDIVIVMTDGNSTNTDDTLRAADRLKAMGAKVITVGIGHVVDAELYGMASSPDSAFNTPDYSLLDTLLAGVSRKACDVSTEEPEEPPKPVVPPCDAPPVDIFFVVDASSSIGGKNFLKGLDFISNIVSHFTLGYDDVQVGLIAFSTRPHLEFTLGQHTDQDQIRDAILSVNYYQFSTRTYLALNQIRTLDLFGPARGGRADANHMVIVITDGRSDNTDKTLAEAQYLRSQGASIISVGIADAVDEELLGMAGGDSDNVFRAANYDLLSYLEKMLTERACEAAAETPVVTPPPHCGDFASPPCDQVCADTADGYECSCNNGYTVNPEDSSECVDVDECADPALNECVHNCTNNDGGYDCSCREGYYVDPNDAHNCLLIPCENVIKADILFIMDSSSSIGVDNYNKTFYFVNNLVRAFKLGPNDVQVAGMIFSRDVKELFSLNDFTDYDQIEAALFAAPYLNSSTYTHLAFRYVGYLQIFADSQGGRSDAADIIILITDGHSNRPTSTLAEASALKSSGITIMAIGVGSGVDQNELEAVASSTDDVFNADSYEVLDYIESQVAERTCSIPATK